MNDDYYHYTLLGDCFVIEGKLGELLIGDQLPETEDEARLLCRCANIAHNQAKKMFHAQLQEKLKQFLSETAL